MGTIGVLWTMAHIARKAPGPARLGTTVRHDLSDFTLIADEPMPLQLDGELIGTRTSVRFQAQPRALNVVISLDR